MTALYTTALEVRRLCEGQRWSFCIIGGVAIHRWGEPRLTRDVDLTLFAGFGDQVRFIQAWLRHFQFRPRRFDGTGPAESSTVVGEPARGTPVDVALGGIDFKRRSIWRSLLWKIPEGVLRAFSAEDLLVHKCSAGREQDWVEVDGVLVRQKRKLDLALVRCELKPLLKLQERPDNWERLQQKIRIHDKPFTTLPPPTS